MSAARSLKMPFAPPEGVPGVVEVAAQRRHGIPSRTDCLACHGSRGGPLGFNALQLSNDRDPLAIHGEPLRPGLLTLRDLMAGGLLRHQSPGIASSDPRNRTASGATRAVLGYVLANCGMCHNGSDDLSVPGPSLTTAELLADGDAVAARMLGRRTRWQIPGTADGASVLIAPGAPGSSAILVRMRSRSPSSQMPPLGTVLRDDEAIRRMAEWIEAELAPHR
jgi:mono/diheme cytochrome c family protein